MPALAVALSNGRVLGFHEGEGLCAVVAVDETAPSPLAAWRAA